MICNHNDTSVRALFLADSHFHVERDPTEEQRYASFLDVLAAHEGVQDVVLMGDIFDFWFDYPHFYLKGYQLLLTALDRVVATGSRLHFIGGNHDIWAAGYLHRRYGTAREGGPLTLHLDGCRLRCTHGDGMLGREIVYRTFRAVVRHPAGVLLGKSLHPEVLFAFSTWLSGHSRHSTRDEAEGIERKARRWLARNRDTSWDHMLIGHVHHTYTCQHDGRSLTSLGGWFDRLHYGVWCDGRFQLRCWAEEVPRPSPTRDD